MSGFVKLFSSITDSSIWGESPEVCKVWITMLAMSDSKGYVGASLPGLAARARVSIEATASALELFMSPDKYSRSQEFEGRRVEVADRGWLLLNYSAFRETRDLDLRREQNRVAKRKSRAASKKLTHADGQQCQPLSAQEEEDQRRSEKKIPEAREARDGVPGETSGETAPKPHTSQASPATPTSTPTPERPLPPQEGTQEARERPKASPAHLDLARQGWAAAWDEAGAGVLPRLAPSIERNAVEFARDVAKKQNIGLYEAAKAIALQVVRSGVQVNSRGFSLASVDPFAGAAIEKPYIDPGW